VKLQRRGAGLDLLYSDVGTTRALAGEGEIIGITFRRPSIHAAEGPGGVHVVAWVPVAGAVPQPIMVVTRVSASSTAAGR